MTDEIHPNILRIAVETIIERADLFPHLERQAAAIVEAARHEGAIHEGPWMTEMSHALYDLNEWLTEVRGYVYCQNCGSLARRSEQDACGCEELFEEQPK